jgi:uncharacterized protein YigA (DUF484 family)
MDSPERLDNSAGLVIEYLRRHPDFLREHPALLRELTVPHLPGPGVASLIERQVNMLRSHCRQLEQELDLRRTRAGLQRDMLQNAQAATLKLMTCEDLRSAWGVLRQSARRDHGADDARLFLFCDDYADGVPDGVRVMTRSANLKFLFIELINRNKPLCGSLQDEHIRILFQGASGHINSTLIVPLRQRGWEGLAALGSHERGRYGRGFELDLLQHLFSVAALRLDRIIGRAPA